MGWLKLDDGFMDHPKIRALSDRAFRVHVQGLCYAARFSTDGFLPGSVFDGVLTRSRRVSRELLSDLWTICEGGYRIHDYLDYNPSKQEILQRKADNARRQARHRERADVTRDSQRPVPSPSSSYPKKDSQKKVVVVEGRPTLELVSTPANGGIETPEQLLAAWNRIATRCRPARVLTKKRREQAWARLQEGHSIKPPLDWEAAIKAVNDSPFCTGFNTRSWRADFEFLLRPDRALWALEGRYSGAVLSGKSNLNVAAVESFVGQSWKNEA